ncbi:UNVERIFIED_CONTAM: hypothetical protein Sradi_1497400 [Sesamum radiatum]|uniref:Uncharacterized protein n=1 Tax=Sesamum radiatum TaxID=300843 RepID=A0AAW2U8F4_SESRA
MEIPQGYMKAKPHQGMTNHYALSAKGISKDISNSKILDPGKPHLNAMMRVLHYLKGTLGQEAEYRAMAYTTTELVWLKYLLNDLSIHLHHPMKPICDNKTALHIAANPFFHERRKLIELDCHFILEKLQDGLITIAYVPSCHQLTDVFTKALGRDQFHFLLRKLMLRTPYSPT